MAVTRDHKTLHLCVLWSNVLQSNMSFNNNCAKRLINLTILLSHIKEKEFKKIFSGHRRFCQHSERNQGKVSCPQNQYCSFYFFSEIISNVTFYAQTKCVFHYTVFNQQMSDQLWEKKLQPYGGRMEHNISFRCCISLPSKD